MAKEDDERTLRVNDARRFLKTSVHFDTLRKDVIEFRLEQAKAEALVPASSQAALLNCERAKGAIVALQGLLFLFDANVPPPIEESEDEPPAGSTI